MDIFGLRQQVPRRPVGQILKCEGHPTIALVDLGSDASNKLRASWPAARPFHSGGVIESAWLDTLLGAGSMAAASLHAGNVFLATANPATLMTIGAGVGSAVMGPTGIVAAAPFVAAKGALIPVVAPLMLFATLSSVIIGARLDRVQRALGRLFEVVEGVRLQMEAEEYARFEGAAEQIDDIRSEFEHCRRFGDDVKFKLALVERDVNRLHSKYGLLVAREVAAEDDAKAAVSELNRFFLASLLDMQVDVLRLYLALQDNPDSVGFHESQLRRKIDRCSEDFRRVLDDDRVGAFHRRLKEDLATLKLSRLLGRGRELAARTRSVRNIRKDFNSIRARVKSWTDAFESANDESRGQSLVFYREPDGERGLRAHHTRDLRLQRA